MAAPHASTADAPGALPVGLTVGSTVGTLGIIPVEPIALNILKSTVDSRNR
jgi:hypothetical protein